MGLWPFCIKENVSHHEKGLAVVFFLIFFRKSWMNSLSLLHVCIPITYQTLMQFIVIHYIWYFEALLTREEFFLLFRSKIISENVFLIFYKDVDTMERLTKLDRNFEPEMDATDVAAEETDASIVQGEDA